MRRAVTRNNRLYRVASLGVLLGYELGRVSSWLPAIVAWGFILLSWREAQS